MKVKTNIKSGSLTANHNEKVIKVKSGVKSGGLVSNHNEKINSDSASLT